MQSLEKRIFSYSISSSVLLTIEDSLSDLELLLLNPQGNRTILGRVGVFLVS